MRRWQRDDYSSKYQLRIEGSSTNGRHAWKGIESGGPNGDWTPITYERGEMDKF